MPSSSERELHILRCRVYMYALTFVILGLTTVFSSSRDREIKVGPGLCEAMKAHKNSPSHTFTHGAHLPSPAACVQSLELEESAAFVAAPLWLSSSPSRPRRPTISCHLLSSPSLSHLHPPAAPRPRAAASPARCRASGDPARRQSATPTPSSSSTSPSVSFPLAAALPSPSCALNWRLICVWVPRRNDR